MSPGHSLARYRRLREWSQLELAERSGVSRTEVSAIETGRLVPSVAVALRLSAALAASVEALFGDAAREAPEAWAWEPAAPDVRRWRAHINDRILAYPVEHTAAGSIPHDVESPAADACSERTLIVAGCDPTVGLLAHEMAARHGIRVIPLLRSSAEAIELLRQGLVHVAGLHLTDAAGRSANDTTVRSRLGSGYSLIHQMRWDSGIAIVGRRRERSAAALLRANVRWVNREEGSAARSAFDRLLAGRRRPAGYSHVVRDHRAVAVTVSSGWAEAGICVKPAASEARLGFIPLQQEAYELCVADAQTDDSRLVALRSTLQSAAYRELVTTLPGCVSRDTGNLRSVA